MIRNIIKRAAHTVDKHGNKPLYTSGYNVISVAGKDAFSFLNKEKYSYTKQLPTMQNVVDNTRVNIPYLGQTKLQKGGFLPRVEYNKNGNRIHIKPENKGKFTATKKRTGKTTEELTHSKNPLTRKRAIFAQNAAKWNHKSNK